MKPRIMLRCITNPDGTLRGYACFRRHSGLFGGDLFIGYLWEA